MLYLAADHNGFGAKEKIKIFLQKNKIAYQDLGNKKFQSQDDYPDFAKKVAQKISQNPQHQGLLFCGSGQGMVMLANRYKNVRAALAYSLAAAKHSRQDEDSNVLSLPVWDLSPKQIEKIIMLWLSTPFSGLTRHCRRIRKLG